MTFPPVLVQELTPQKHSLQESPPLRANTPLKSKFLHKEQEYPPTRRFDNVEITLLRMTLLAMIYLCYQNMDMIQNNIDMIWRILYKQWWFNSVYLETGLVVVLAYPSILTYQIIDKIHFFDKYRIDPEGGRIKSDPIPHLIKLTIIYVTPLALLDTFHVKHYHGVSYDIIKEKRLDWVQKTRALPEDAPLFADIIIHIIVAIVIYDALFSIIHYNLHKNATLYRIFHKIHHTHEVITVKVTDQQNWIERIVFIFCANGGLKVQGAHPMTRAIFVLIFISLLLYNHSGYDFPWALDKLVPFGIVAGAREHYEHHATGKRNYQFIFTYMDNFLEWNNRRKKTNQL